MALGAQDTRCGGFRGVVSGPGRHSRLARRRPALNKPGPGGVAGARGYGGWMIPDPGFPLHRDHFVQFYDTDAHLVECLGSFIASGLRRGETVLCIADAAHRAAVARHLAVEGDLAGALEHHRYIPCDAEEVLARFMVAGGPDEGLFRAVVEELLERPRAEGRPVRAFGEMVAMLRGRGEALAAETLEDLWNRVLDEHGLTLYCAYPRSQFGDRRGREFERVCCQHSRILPADPAAARTLLAAG
jgi:hypothetical protein